MQKLIEVKAAKEFAHTFLADPILKMAVNAVLENAPEANVSKLTSAEKQAIFRLGQMDMRDSLAAMLRDEAERAGGTIKIDFLTAAEMVATREIP